MFTRKKCRLRKSYPWPIEGFVDHAVGYNSPRFLDKYIHMRGSYTTCIYSQFLDKQKCCFFYFFPIKKSCSYHFEMKSKKYNIVGILVVQKSDITSVKEDKSLPLTQIYITAH